MQIFTLTHLFYETIFLKFIFNLISMYNSMLTKKDKFQMNLDSS